MMCRDLSDELSQFDLHKEKELKQVLLDYAAAQLERHEKVKRGESGSGWTQRLASYTKILPHESRVLTHKNTPM